MDTPYSFRTYNYDYDQLFISEYINALRMAEEIQRKKGEDYNSSDVSYDEYTKFDKLVYQWELWKKVLRLRSLKNQDQIHNESIEDTLLDIINYAGFALAAIKMEERNENPSQTESSIDRETIPEL